MYIQRYLSHFPAAGEVVIFDRSWYNRAGVERVMGFCTQEESDRFLALVPTVERAMVDSGILLVKYWLEVSQEEQTRRLQSRIDDPRKIWKLSGMDLLSYARWYDYSRARDTMLRSSDSSLGPLVRGRHQQQAAWATEHHQPPAQSGPLRPADTQGRRAAEAAGGQRLRRADPPLRHIPTPFRHGGSNVRRPRALRRRREGRHINACARIPSSS